jgi:hypothetical protein
MPLGQVQTAAFNTTVCVLPPARAEIEERVSPKQVLGFRRGFRPDSFFV